MEQQIKADTQKTFKYATSRHKITTRLQGALTKQFRSVMELILVMSDVQWHQCQRTHFMLCSGTENGYKNTSVFPPSRLNIL